MGDEGIALRPGVRRGLAAGLLVVLAAVALLNSLGRTPVDIKPEVYLAPWRTAASYLSSWQTDPQLGFPSFNVGLAPVAVLVGVIQVFGVSAGVSAHVLRGLLAAGTAWGTARLYRSVVDERDDVGALTAAVVSVANPYTLVAGSTLAISLPLALLPWQLLAVVAAVRRGGWRAPAAFALTLFAMSGANAGVVPIMQGLAVPVVAFWLAHHEGFGVRRALAALARCVVLGLLVSLYWIVPALSATGAGTTVLSNSESLDGIAGVSSFAEVLRGLGLWPMYGSDQNGPWQPQFVGYLDNPVVLTASFLLPVLAALAVAVSRGRHRRLALWLVVPAAVIMVGLYPVGSPTPFGRALRYAFERAPATGAFRTTNKIGAMFVLGLALLLAAGVTATLRRVRRDRRPWVAAALGLVLAVGVAPAWTGNLYTSFVDVPGYWQQAARHLDDGSSERVWFVPGERQAHYRWTQERPDDVSLALLSRPSLVRTVIPVTGTGAANLLAALDTGLQEGTLAPGTLSAAARTLGVGTVLLRNDQVWEDDAGARPAVLQNVINADSGLTPVRNYGQPGENVVPGGDVELTPAEAQLPPLQQWDVRDPQPVLGARSAARALLVSGDGYAVDELHDAGLQDGTRPMRYLADLRTDGVAAFRRAVGDGGRIVLTDTDRRRTTSENELTDGQGPLLPAAADPGTTRSLGTAQDQTVLVDEGGSVTASQQGSVFGPLPYTAPENAFDGDAATSWQFGDFGTGVGATLTATFGRRAVPTVTVHAGTDGQHVSRVRLALHDGTRTISHDVATDPSGTARWTPPAGTRADTLTLTVLATAGLGFNRLSIDTVDVPGVRITRVARLPDTLDALTRTTGVGLLQHTPIDLTFARVEGNALGDSDDEERQLERDFRLPVGRDYRASATVDVRGRIPDDVLDQLAGAGGTVTATGSSRLFDNPDFRASYALDGNPDTAWTPGIPATGESITVQAPPQRITHITLDQTARAGGPRNAATRVRILLDGRPVRTAAAHLGRTTITVPPQRAGTLTVQILKTLTNRSDAPLQLAELGFGGARIQDDPTRARTACVTVATLDGQPLQLHPTAPLVPGAPVTATGCGAIPLAAGSHQLRGVDGTFALNRLALHDTVRPAATTAAAPRVRVTDRGRTGATVHVTGGRGAYWLGLGQSLDPRWTAQLDGHPLGPPQLLDGWQAGWRVVADGRAHTVTFRYGPQRAADVALGVSAAALLGCGALVVGAGRLLRGRRPGRRLRGRLRGRLARRRPRQRPERVTRPPRAVPRPAREATGLAAALVFGGWLALAAAAVVVGVLRWRAVPARVLAVAAAGLFAAVPVLWGIFRPDGVPAASPAVVTDNPWPGRAAVVGLVVLVAAVATADPERRRPTR